MADNSKLPIQGSFTGPFDFEKGSSSEWLVTNGAGAFASSSLIDCPTRKYHGLLVTPLPGREGRYHLLSAIEARPSDDPDFSMAVNKYPGAVHPRGYENLSSFESLPHPRWHYRKKEREIRKEVFMLPEEPSVYIAFTLLSGGPALDLELKMLFTCRDANYTTHENASLSMGVKQLEGGFKIQPYPPLPSCAVSFSGRWEREDNWYWDRNIEYPIEERRGLESTEDRFVPGNVKINLKKDKPFIIRISLGDSDSDDLEEIYSKVLASTEGGVKKVKTARDFLKERGSCFLVKNSLGGSSINAGFPWFGEWGRDTMIALPGLTFCSGRKDLGISILADYASLIRDGLLPNTLGESQGFTSYNSMDAGLLYCWAVRKLLDEQSLNKTQLARLEKKIHPAILAIVTAFSENRVPNARLEETGLLNTGSPDTQLTWMDATAWGKPVTPRHGLAVDLNALWYDALCTLKRLSEMFQKKTPEFVSPFIEKIEKNFSDTFLLRDEAGNPAGLSDTVVEGRQDGKIRPNMLFAASASPGLLSREVRLSVVERAKKELLTPMGMRTLGPGDRDFSPCYEGGSEERDSVYHQGTVWPWPIGIMAESAISVKSSSLAAEDLEKESLFWKEYFENLLEKHLYRQGIGFVSEIFDGLVPEEGKGCFAQAWSTGEILRALDLIDEALKTGDIK